MEAGAHHAEADRLSPSGSAIPAAGLLSLLLRPRLLLALAMVASGTLLLVWQSHLGFSIDDWDLLLHRRGFSVGAFLDPHVRHIIIAPAAIYKAIQATIGMESLLPYAVVSTAFFLTSVLLLFVYLSRRVGDWLALAGVLPVLFMGAAYEDLLSPFQVNYFGAVALGIGALLVLERRDARGDALACVLLVGSLVFSELALAFAAGAAVAIALDRGPWRRGYVALVPALLYAVWYVGWQSGHSDVSLHSVATSPSYALDGMGISIASLLGLGVSSGTALGWGRILLVAAIAAAWLWPHARSRYRGWFLVALAIALTFWFLTAANSGLFRPVSASRYQYVGAVFVLMIAAELARGLRVDWRVVAAVLAISIAATVTNLQSLKQSYENFRGFTEIERGALAGLEIARDRVNPGLQLTTENSNVGFFGQLDAGPYLSAEEKFGSPAYSLDELPTAPESARVGADKVLGAALGLVVETGSERNVSGPRPTLVGGTGSITREFGACLTVRPNGEAAILRLPVGGVAMAPAPGVGGELKLRRYATSFPINAGALTGPEIVRIPPDRSTVPWQLQLGTSGPVTVCGLPGA